MAPGLLTRIFSQMGTKKRGPVLSASVDPSGSTQSETAMPRGDFGSPILVPMQESAQVSRLDSLTDACPHAHG